MVQKNSRPSHPTTCGKVERFQQTLKKWLRAQPNQPATIAELQALIDRVPTELQPAPPAPLATPPSHPRSPLRHACPKPCPADTRDAETHDRVRHDRVDKSGTVTLRVHGRLRHIGVGRTHTGTHVILLVQDLEVRIVNAITGELLRELTIDPARTTSPRTPEMNNSRTYVPQVRLSRDVLRHHIGSGGRI